MTTNRFNNPRPDAVADAPRSRKKRRRPKRLQAGAKPKLTVAQILAWADAHYKRTARWPKQMDGPIGDAWDTTWRRVDEALRYGNRGLAGGSSLARLLSERRGARYQRVLPAYRIPEVLAWADAHRRLTGSWPTRKSGPIRAATGETWSAVETALARGVRGLPGGSSLAQLLAAHRGVRNIQNLPRLTVANILRWADSHFKRTGRWPKRTHGAIVESPGDAWSAIDKGLRKGSRGLAGGSSLTQLLHERRGARNHYALAKLSERQILAWADAYHRRQGKWPKLRDGSVAGAPGETWMAIEGALSLGGRGLPGGSSLAQLLQRRRGVRNKRDLPRFRLSKIVAWARAHRRRTGKLPTRASGPIIDSPGDTWMAVEMALVKGRRGLPGGSSLHQLLKARLG